MFAPKQNRIRLFFKMLVQCGLINVTRQHRDSALHIAIRRSEWRYCFRPCLLVGLTFSYQLSFQWAMDVECILRSAISNRWRLRASWRDDLMPTALEFASASEPVSKKQS
jgi:hypothetical protein